MDVRPIPALYCCYLLRSKNRPSSLYVGSTPNPRRRLAQHNGHCKGGAVRTASERLRPWEMVCVVAGFSSNIAALQFEWAWQNSHLTRRINEEQRITMRKSITKVTKSGRVRRRPARPRMSLGDKLSNLHLLLRVPSFAQWPLALHFFSDDVYQRWMRCAKDATIELRSGMKITLNFQNTEAERASARDIGACERSIVEGPCQGGIESLDSSYAPYKTHLAKSLFILADGELVHCVVCGHGIRTPDAMGLVCPNDECRAASHVTCLASKFLRGEANRNLLPVRGNCPSCNLQLQWSRLVTELSLRLRGSKEIVQLQRKACKRKINEASVKTAHGLCSTVDDDAENDIDDVDQQDTDEELSIGDVVDEPLIDEAQNHPLSDMDDTRSVHSAISDNSQFSDLRSPAKSNVPESRLNTVIEDSDWDAAEVLD